MRNELVANENRWSPRSLILGSQLVLAAALAICVALMPQFLFSSNMGGISNYGVHPRTVVPYTAGIVLSAGLLLKAAAQLVPTQAGRALAPVCRITGVLLLLNLFSTYPYQAAPAWERVHHLCAILLAVAELIGAVILAGLLRDWAGYTVLAIAMAAGLVMALTQLGLLHVLFVAEITTGAAFGVLLVRAAGRASGALL